MPATQRRLTARPTFWKAFGIPILLVLGTIGLGWHGFHDYHQAVAAIPDSDMEPLTVWDSFYFAAALPLLETVDIDEHTQHIPTSLHVARVASLFILPYAFVLGLWALFHATLRPFHIRRWSWSWFGRKEEGTHIVVCGLGWIGRQLVQELRDCGERVVVVERNPDNPFVEAAERAGAIVLLGDATQPEMLEAAGITHAKKVYVVCKSDETDVLVAKRVVGCLERLGRGKWKPLVCAVDIEEVRLRDLLHEAVGSHASIHLHCFDTFETTARRLIEKYPVDRLPPSQPDGAIHAIVFGFSSMGQAIVRQLLQIGHFGPGRTFSLRIVTPDPVGTEAELLNQFPCFRKEAYGPDFEPVREEVLPRVDFMRTPASDLDLLDSDAPHLSGIQKCSAVTYFLCVDDGTRSSALATALKKPIAAALTEKGGDAQIQLYYNYPGEDHVGVLNGRNNAKNSAVSIYSFGDFLERCNAEVLEGRPLDDLARQIADHYRSYYRGDSWEELPESDRESNRQAADHIAVKLRRIGAEIVDRRAARDFQFTPEESTVLARMEHGRWVCEKLLDGWRPLPCTNENREAWADDKKQFKDRKVHIGLVSFDSLDKEGQEKDIDQICGIPKFLEAVGLGIRRVKVRNHNPR